MRLEDLIRMARTQETPKVCPKCNAPTDATLTAEIDRYGDFAFFTLAVRCSMCSNWHQPQDFDWTAFDNSYDRSEQVREDLARRGLISKSAVGDVDAKKRRATMHQVQRSRSPQGSSIPPKSDSPGSGRSA